MFQFLPANLVNLFLIIPFSKKKVPNQISFICDLCVLSESIYFIANFSLVFLCSPNHTNEKPPLILFIFYIFKNTFLVVFSYHIRSETYPQTYSILRLSYPNEFQDELFLLVIIKYQKELVLTELVEDVFLLFYYLLMIIFIIQILQVIIISHFNWTCYSYFKELDLQNYDSFYELLNYFYVIVEFYLLLIIQQVLNHNLQNDLLQYFQP